METTLVYGACIIIAVVWAAMAYLAVNGFEDDWSGHDTHPVAYIFMVIFLLLAVASLSPLAYEFPNWSTDLIVVECTDSGVIEHPKGAFCLEGNPRFYTVPRRSSIIWEPYWVKPEQFKNLELAGFVTITDYQKLFSHKPAFTSYNASLEMIDDIVYAALDSIVKYSSAELQQFRDDKDKSQQQAFRSFLNERVNQIIAVRGLHYEASKFLL